MRAKTVRPTPSVRLEFKLLGRTIAPMLTPDTVSRAAVGAMMRKSKHLPRVVDQRAEREQTLTPQHTDIPDPRLVELVRLLARRAAQRWYEKAIKARSAPRP